ncbi:MAG TPA: type II toxin-antitoxin system HicA family toxin [Phormidium sp.]
MTIQNPPPVQTERQYAKPDDSKPIPTGKVNSGEIIGRVYYVRGVPPTFIEDYNNWIKNPFKRTGSRTLYTSTFALFFVSSLSAWIIIELVLSAKRNEQHLAQQQREQLQREIQQIKLQLEEKNQQTIKLIDQRERGLAELESYRQGQEQNKRELENQIASYESELALKEQQQQETAQTLEDDLQLLWQEWQETSQRESEAKQRSEELNQTIADLKRDRDLIQQQSRQLEQPLETIPNINELNAALEGSRAELERIKAGSRDFEVYLLEENHKLEEKKADLDRELNSAKEQIRYLQKMYDNNSLIPDTQEIVIDSSSSAGARSRLRNVSVRDAVRSLERLGFTEDRQKGSHVTLKKTITRTISVTISIHKGQSLDRGTLSGIIRQAEITREDFLDNL